MTKYKFYKLKFYKIILIPFVYKSKYMKSNFKRYDCYF